MRWPAAWISSHNRSQDRRVLPRNGEAHEGFRPGQTRWDERACSTAKDLALNALTKRLPVGRNGIASIHGRAATFDLVCPRLVDVRFLLLVETLEKPGSQFRPLVYRQPQSLREQFIGVGHLDQFTASS